MHGNDPGFKKFKCDSCDKSYDDKGNLRRHKRTKHEMVRFPCSQCDLTFTCSSYVRDHVRTVHVGQLIKCNECDYKTATKGRGQRKKNVFFRALPE